jgi:hypothetical protein
MGPLIATALLVATSTGFIFGMLWAGRLTERECELAYLVGHVDGHRKAEDDGGVL